jgi:hypothetical protein
METTLHRATSLDETTQRLATMVTPEGIGRAFAFTPRPSDVIISPFAKCGTTWLQQIVHGLRTRGDIDFDDISRVVPWIETSPNLGLDLDAEQKAEPRAYKSHLPWHVVPKGGRYIVAFRDPKDALVSMYYFMSGWFFEPGTVSLEEWAFGRFLDRSEGRDYWTHLLSWWQQRDNESVLLLAYETMKRDLAATIRTVAAFAGIATDTQLLDLVERQASVEFMRQYKDRFDDLLMRRRSEEVAGLPSGSDSSKVRVGKVGGHKQALPAQVVDALDATWREVIEPQTGLASYEALVASLPRTELDPSAT